MVWFVAFLLLGAGVSIVSGIQNRDISGVAAGTFFFAAPAAAIIYFKFRQLFPASPKAPHLNLLVEEEERLRQETPPRPVMTVPSPGNIGVAFQQTKDAVWVWIDLSETIKHILSDSQALGTPVDEFSFDKDSENLQQMLDHIDGLEESQFYTKHDKEKEKRQRIKEWTRPQYITLREILANPYRHYERDSQKRLEYLDKLKAKILPKVKSIIEGHTHSKSGSFEL